MPIGVARALGAGALLLTNAAASLRPQAGPGSLVAITDHLNLSGLNPLVGMVGGYDAALRWHLRVAAKACAVPLHEGVCAWFSGPSFETPAEVGMAGRLSRVRKSAPRFCGQNLRQTKDRSGRSVGLPTRTCLGADLVGMSTVPEVILARFFGLAVAAVSVVANRAAGIDGGASDHAETRAAAKAAPADLARLVEAFVVRLP